MSDLPENRKNENRKGFENRKSKSSVWKSIHQFTSNLFHEFFFNAFSYLYLDIFYFYFCTFFFVILSFTSPSPSLQLL